MPNRTISASELSVGDKLVPGEETITDIKAAVPGYLFVKFVANGKKRTQEWQLPKSWPLIVERSNG